MTIPGCHISGMAQQCPTSWLRWPGKVAQCLLVSVGLSVPAQAAGPTPAASLQDLVQARAATRRARGAEVRGPETTVQRPYAVIRAGTYALRVDDDSWRRDAYEYQGMAVLDGRYLDFAYGGDDFVTYAFEASEVKNGGRVSLAAIAAADPGDLVLRVSPDNETWTTIGSVDSNGHYGAVIEPQPTERVYLMLDGRSGNGLVLGPCQISFYMQRPQHTGLEPTPAPTPAPDEEREETSGPGKLGYVPGNRGSAGLDQETRERSFSRGQRVDPSKPGSGITVPERVRFRKDD